MRLLRTLPTRRLLALLAAVVAVVAGGTAIALAAGGRGPVPPAKPLARSISNSAAKSTQPWPSSAKMPLRSKVS